MKYARLKRRETPLLVGTALFDQVDLIFKMIPLKVPV